MNSSIRKDSGSLFLLWSAVIACTFFCIWWACIDATRSLGLSLGVLKPFVDTVSQWGALYMQDARGAVPYIACGAGSILLLGYVFHRKRASLFYLVTALFVAAEAFLILSQYDNAAIAGALALVTVILWWGSSDSGWKGSTYGFGSGEMYVVLGIVLLAAFYRFYALNQVVPTFEGELAPYYAGATSFEGLFAANRGLNGPWAPLGILYYLPIYITTSLFGVTIVALRASSALVGVLTVPLIYIFTKKLAGRSTATIASLLFALDALHIGWSRTDVHPHGVTTWPTLLLCISLLESVRTKRWSWYLALMFCMGLTWHQYPSGQSAVGIPFIAVFLYLTVNLFKQKLPKLLYLFIFLGAALWVIGLPLSYYLADGRWNWMNLFTLTGPRTAWGNTTQAMSFAESLQFVLMTAVQHLWDVIRGIFFLVPYLFHQDFVPEVPGLPMRTVPWLLAPLVAGGFLITLRRGKQFESCVLVAWVIAAIIPGILSEHAYPKRLSTLYPAMDILAAVSVGYLISISSQKFYRYLFYLAISVGMLGYAVFMTNAWFAGRQWKYGIPYEISVASEISSMIEPGTIVIADLVKDYDSGKMTYLLLDSFTDPAKRPNAWFLVLGGPQELNKAVESPRSVIQIMNRPDAPWVYVWTKLRDQYKETINNTQWKKVVYIFQQREPPNWTNAEQEQRVLAGCAHPVRKQIPSKDSFINPFIVVSCTIS